MKWYKDLYVGAIASENQKKIIRKIKSSKFQINIFVLCTPLNSDNVMDIIPSSILLQSYFNINDITIYGIAEGYDEALELMQTIIMDCYEKTGEFDITKL